MTPDFIVAVARNFERGVAPAAVAGGRFASLCAFSVAVTFALLFSISELRGQGNSPPSPAPATAATLKTPAPTPTAEQLQADLAKADAARTAAKPGTKERADAAQTAQRVAADIAWLAFDAGKFEEAATGFARSAELTKDYQDNRRAYWEESLQTEVPKTEKGLADRIKQFETQLAAEPDEAKKKELHHSIDGLERMRQTVRYNAISMLETVARETRNYSDYVKYAQEELTIRRSELKYLEDSDAPKNDVNLKKVEVAHALERIAGAQAELALFDEAEKNFREALALRRALPEMLAERRVDEALSGLARMYSHNLGDLKKARELYEEALTDLHSTTAVREKALEADYWSPETKAKMPPEDVARHEKSLTENRDMLIAMDALSEGMILGTLGDITQETGDFAAARSFYDRALKLVEALPQGGYINIFELVRARIRGFILSSLGDLHASSGETAQALKELDEAAKLKRSVGDNETSASAIMLSASILYRTGEIEKAKQYVEQARKIFAAAHRLPSLVAATGFLAILARDAGQIDEAARDAAEALSLASKTGNFGMVGGSARTFASIRLKQAKIAEAKGLLEQAKGADAHTNSMTDKMATLGIFGEALEAEGKNDEALENYREAVKLVESIRATAASESLFAEVKANAKPFERIVRLLVKMKRNDEAFDYLNRAKSKKLQDALPLSSLQTSDKATQAKINQLGDLERKKQAADTQRQTEEAKPAGERDETKVKNLKLIAASTDGEYNELVENIKTANPNWEKMMTTKPAELQASQDGIPDGVTFVQYAPVGEQMYVFIVTNKTLKVYTPPVKPEDLFKKIRTVRKQITTGESGAALDNNLCALYDMVIKPIEPELTDTKTIGFIPNGPLFYLPMQALAKKQPDGKIRYLIEDKEIVYLTAADVMRVVQVRSTKKSRGGMVAFGNPTGAELPSADIEVKAIAAIFPDTEVLSGAQVTKEAVSTEKRLEKRIVHFATHGFLNSTTPKQSYLQLASGGAPGQNELTVKEIWSLPLKKVEIATLSACQTGLGNKEPDGGEITTLAEAFSRASVPSVVASLWSVGDESTKEFMVEFYKQLAAGTSKGAALQSADLKLMKNPKYARPLYWAPFILMGDWRGLP